MMVVGKTGGNGVKTCRSGSRQRPSPALEGRVIGVMRIVGVSDLKKTLKIEKVKGEPKVTQKNRQVNYGESLLPFKHLGSGTKISRGGETRGDEK